MFSMSVERDIRFDLIARLCPNTTGAELRSVATEVSLQIYPHFWLFTLVLGWNVCYPCTTESGFRTRFP